MRSQDHAQTSGSVTSGPAWDLLQAAKFLSRVADSIYIRGLSNQEANVLADAFRRLDLAIAAAEGPAPSSAKPLEGEGSRDTATLPPQASEGTP